MRKIIFQTGQYYHIYNRGVDKREIFCEEKNYERFLKSMREFNCLEPIGSLYDILKRHKRPEAFKEASGRLVEFISYCLMPNHFHFILKQSAECGISKFMQKLSMGYANYFNNRYQRSGALFQGAFKSIHITTNDYLLWLSAYINGNSEIHKISKAEKWPWSSYKDYSGLRTGTLCEKDAILNQFENINEYRNLVETVIKESGERKDEVKKYLLE